MKALDRLRVLTRLHDLRDEPDAALVRRFAAARDEAAFELLVRRHGPLVLGVCRRALGDAAAADDAFQATFLLLARRAPALREPAGVAGWLYGVAARTAREARRQERRRARREQRVARHEAVAALPDDTAAAVEAAVRRLPEPYRSAVLLCDLSGRTRDQAAAELGAPPGTVASRLSRGRQLLAADLLRRGVTLGAVGLAAAVPAELAASTARLGVLLAAGEATVPPAVGTLLIHGGRTMLPLGLWKVAAGVLVLGGAAVVLPGGQKPAEPPAPAAAQPARPPTPAERLAKIKAEYEAVERAATSDPRPGPGGTTVRTVGAVGGQKYIPALIDLGRSDDADTAFEALWMTQWVVGGYVGDDRNRRGEALDLLFKRFGRTDRMLAFARWAFMPGNRPVWFAHFNSRAVLGRIAATAADREIVATSLFFAALLADEGWADPPGWMKPAERAAARASVVAGYERVVTEFADVRDEHGRPFGEQARHNLKRLHTAVAGLPAPDTAGGDLAGLPMRLSDYTGKMVVLHFWGSWCGPCKPHLTALKQVAAKYTGKGVVFLSVAAERDLETARKSAAEHDLPWRSWFDRLPAGGGNGPLADAWFVGGYPSLRVVGRDGKIAHVHSHPAMLEGQLDALLAGKPEG